MSRRSSRMPLYEVMRTGARRPPGQGIASPGDGGDVRFGGIVRLPVGVVLLAASVVILALVGAYALGHTRAKADHERQLDEIALGDRENVDDLRRAMGNPNLDPRGPVTEQGNTREPARPSGPADGPPGSAGPDVATGEGDPASDWQRPRAWWAADRLLDPIEVPYVTGQYFWVLMTVRREADAERFIDFARAEGLETYAFMNDDGRFVVYLVPGLNARSESHPWYPLMRAAIDRLSQAWARDPGSGGVGLDGYYLSFLG